MLHALQRDPIDLCKERGEDAVVVGNSGVVRVERVGSAVTSLSAGDIGIVFGNGIWDEQGYPIKIVGYDVNPRFGAAAGGAVQQIVGRDQVPVYGVSQVRQVDAAERAVPVTAVALGTIQFRPCGVDEIGRGLRDVFQSREPIADLEHPAIHLVGFRVLCAKIAPEAAAHESLSSMPVSTTEISSRPSVPPCSSRMIRRTDPCSVNLIALPARLVRIWRNRAGSV